MLEIDYNTDTSPYELIQKIGCGKYSEVFCALNRNNACMCVCKILKPVRLRKIKREISILRNLCGGPNVVRLFDVLRDDSNDMGVGVAGNTSNANYTGNITSANATNSNNNTNNNNNTNSLPTTATTHFNGNSHDATMASRQQQSFHKVSTINSNSTAYSIGTGTPILVTEFVPNAVTLRALMLANEISNFDMRYYLYEVLRTLDFAHKRGIFHRDIKPHNIMINHDKKILRVIDWGLAEYYVHGEPLNCGVATRHYKAPELLVGYRHYDFSLDIWCTGCVLAGMLFKSDPFFEGNSNEEQLL
uniref:Putative casein kinase II subunit alpha n=1 Tax=Lygus hesperus TaxID=30085 RepID=A0A0A9WHN5_LYGHE